MQPWPLVSLVCTLLFGLVFYKLCGSDLTAPFRLSGVAHTAEYGWQAEQPSRSAPLSHSSNSSGPLRLASAQHTDRDEFSGQGQQIAGFPAPLKGLNLPNQDQDTNCGAFKPGILTYAYSDSDLDQVVRSGFTALRLPLNVETANDRQSLSKLKHYIDYVGGHGVLGMWETLQDCAAGHGDGLIQNVTAWTRAWKAVHEVFAERPGVMYEVFNEPHGYKNAKEYVALMKQIVEGAGLPQERCIIGGTGYQSNVANVAQYWDGALGYHLYPNWRPPGKQHQSDYSRLVQKALHGLSTRVYITEFGAALDRNNPDYERVVGAGHPDENCLRGLDDALLSLRAKGEQVRGAFHWHGGMGWAGANDSYDFFRPANSNGAHKVQKILSYFDGEGATPSDATVQVVV